MQVTASPATILPSVDALLRRPEIASAVLEYGRSLVVQELRDALDRLRATLGEGAAVADRDAAAVVVERQALVRLQDWAAPPLRKIFNLSGTVLHTNLGRAPLPPEAIAAMAAASDACNLEYDLQTGGRGERDDHVIGLICRLTGAEDAVVVNNNAAAVLLALNSLANRRDVLVSRGELVEIGGAFRIPDVMARAGARRREVGTTNRTHLSDFAGAIGPRTAAIMKVHASNYAISGFTAEVPEPELAALARERGIPFLNDLGSGSLVDLERYGLPHEPTPMEALRAGADLVTFSGDKLLGGPQAGLVVGKAALIAKLRKNPLKRALRVDKLIMAALAAVLRLYLDPARLAARLPSLRRLTRPEAEIRAAAERVAAALSARCAARVAVSIVSCASQIGSGSRPVDLLPSAAVALRVPGGRALAGLAKAFRQLPIPVIGRLHDGALLFDLRCLEDEAGFISQLDRLARD